MSKFSVKKPLTVFVSVVAILVLGVVAYLRMTPDLLPNMDFPYVLIVTAYPGASPEKVEAEITKPMEQAMSTLEHIKEVSSSSGENSSMVILQFEDSVNMDTIGVDIQQQITTLSASWDDMVMTPYVLKINPSMLPVEVAAVSMDGMDTVALTEFLNETLLNKLEGIPGVARISTNGMIEQELHVILDQKKIDKVNERIADAINGKLDDAAQELADKKQELEDSKSELEDAEGKLSQSAAAIVQGQETLKNQKYQLEDTRSQLESQRNQAEQGRMMLSTTLDTLNTLNDQVNAAEANRSAAQERLDIIEDLQRQREEIWALEQEIRWLEGMQQPNQPSTEPPQQTDPAPTVPEQSEPIGELEGSQEPSVGPGTETQPSAEPAPAPAQTEQLPAPTEAAPAPEQPIPAQEEAAPAPVEEPPAPAEPAPAPAEEYGNDPEEPEGGEAQPELIQTAFEAEQKGTPVVIDLGGGIKTVILRSSVGTAVQSLTDVRWELDAKKTELAQKRAIFQADLAANGLTEDRLDEAERQAREELEQATRVINGLDAALAQMGTSREELVTTAAETEAQLAELDSGIEQLESALTQLDDGLISIDQAQDMLERQKTLGMVQISSAAAKIAAGSASIDMGLSQIDSGLEELESSRKDALRKADLNNIVTMDMVTGILTAQNFSMPAGYVTQDGINYMVSVGDEITQLETLENLLLFDMGMEGLEPVYLKDVAVVVLTDNRNETYAKLNGQDGVMLDFEKQSTYATAETTNNIQKRFRELEQEYPGLQFVALMNQGDYIYLIVDSILNSLLLGSVFAILVLLLFLRDLRPTFITLCSIPISVIFAVVLMYFSNVTINMISLSGLAVAVGMLVDNSVVVIENIYRLRAKGANVIQAAASGAMQVAGSVTASTLTTVCVFLPIVFVEGITRQLFTDLALTMSYALLASLAVSLTLVPAMASGMLRREKKPHVGLLEKFLLPLYKKTVSWTLRHKAVVLLISLALLIASAMASVSKGFTFMPEMDMPNVNVSVTMPEGVDMEEASALADEVLNRMAQVEGIETVGAMMDASTVSVGGMAQTSYDITVYVILSDETASGAAIGREIEARCADLPCTVKTSSAMMDMSMLTGSGVSVNIYCDDMAVLQAAAETAGEVLGGVEGLEEISNGLEDAAPALHVAVDRNAAMKNGLTVAQVYMELAEGLKANGNVASLKLDGITTKIIIEKPKGAVLDVQALRDYVFEVTDREGNSKEVALKDFAQVENTWSLSTIKRINQRRYLSVTAQVKPGFNVTRLTAQAEAAMAGVDLGEGVSYRFTGENESIMEAVEQLGLMLLLGVVLVYLVMVAQFQSLKSPFIVMFTIPLAFTGGFLGLLLCGMEVSVISLIGFVMLTGIIVNNGIVLVDYVNQLRQEGMERREAIVEAGCTRMRPILMTTITTVLGLIDMAVRKSAGTAMMQPVAVVCIGGLVYATFMTLFVVPCIYDMLNKKELRSVREEDLKLLDI